jgi:hypothetical protein
MEKDFVQSIKLEISKNFTLTPYERIAFHKVLGIVKSENGMQVLLRDLGRRHPIRASAIDVLKEFNSRRVTEAFLPLLSNPKISEDEHFSILTHLEQFAGEDDIPLLLDFISQNTPDERKLRQITRAIHILGSRFRADAGVITLLSSIGSDRQLDSTVRSAAIETTCARTIAYYEALLEENNDIINTSVYRALALIAEQEMIKYQERSEDDLFTILPDENDKTLLEIRVLLGKQSSRFDAATPRAKAAFILAMISCGHREYIIYAMKALTSSNTELIDKTLFVIRTNVDKIRTPDAFLRNLISLASVTSRDSELIIEIFEAFLTGLRQGRNASMIRNKIYNFIIVMLDSYFETYRKNFMIPEIMEKDYPENFRRIRYLILNRFTPEIKRRILAFLADDSLTLKSLMEEIGEKVSYISETESESMRALMDILWDKDTKARSVSASRIEDIDFEKRYLKNRILRLCEIIGRLAIDEASSMLVKIFNYIKKYNDPEIFDSVTRALSRLNYPYMLSELEVLLLSGDLPEKRRAVELFGLFSEQRSLNILLDWLKENHDMSEELTTNILQILLRRDIANNKAANQIAKTIAERNRYSSIRRMAVQIIGKCGFESDILYLNELFIETNENIIREGIVQALDHLLKVSSLDARKNVLNLLKNCLLDSAIRVRMYACMTLLQDGNTDALKTLRDMMIIRNREVQRDILLTLGGFITIDLAYFYISLLREEYSISQDIIPLLQYLPDDEKKDIDHFIINIFKKHEGFGDFTIDMSREVLRDEERMKHFRKETVTILNITVYNYSDVLMQLMTTEMADTAKTLYRAVFDEVKSAEGVISRMTGGSVVIYFPNPLPAAQCALSLKRRVQSYNARMLPSQQLNICFHIAMREGDISSDELIIINDYEPQLVFSAGFRQRIVVAKETARILEYSFRCNDFTDLALPLCGLPMEIMELENELNFTIQAEEILARLKEDDKRRFEEQQQIEQAIKTRHETRTHNIAAYTNKMDEIGRMLKQELREVHKYISKRSNDRELIRNTEQMIENINKRYQLEVSKTVLD